MATNKTVVWQPRAKRELREILSFYNNRNGSSRYSDRLFAEMEHWLSRISDDWQLGEKVDEKNVRRIVVENFLIYYLITPESVDVLSVRDGRRKPKKFKMSEIIMNTEPDA